MVLTSKPGTAQSTRARVSGALASSAGILVVVPAMVAALGIALTLLGLSALRTSNTALATERFQGQAKVIAQTIDSALTQADPIRARLKEIAEVHGPGDDPTDLAYELSDLLVARPGVAYVSVSFPDGTFVGAFFEDEGKSVRFQRSNVLGNGKTAVRIWDPTHRDGLRLVRDETTSYDPRDRAFYKLASASQRPVFTDPYPFYKTFVTGITYAEALRTSDGTVKAVTTIDFDVEALSAVLASSPAPEGSVLVLSADNGTVLALPHLLDRFPDLQFPTDRALTEADVPDPLLHQLLHRGADAGDGPGRIDVGTRRFFFAREKVGSALELPWVVSVAVPEDQFLGELRVYERWSVIAAAIALALAIGISILFARHITRARKEASDAKAEARELLGRARELGSYDLVDKLASGGMGELWRGEHRLLARPAAIKLIRIDDGGDAAAHRVAEERFRREAKTLSRLESRSTVKIFDYGAAEDGTLYLVMELLTGANLDELVKRDGAQPAARVIFILVQALRSLDEAHRAGLVHRDIKPANIFLSRAAAEVDIVKVLDFGLVRVTHETDNAIEAAPASGPGTPPAEGLTSKQGYLGTPAFMAPEQIRNREVDGRTDLYALGCVAYFLLTGTVLFGDKTGNAALVAHMTKAPPQMGPLVKGWLPEELASVVSDCLIKDAQKRPADAAVVIQRLLAIPIPEEERWTDERALAWWDHAELENKLPAGPSRKTVVPRRALYLKG